MNASAIIVLLFLGSIFGLGETGELQTAVKEVFREVLGLHPPEGSTARTINPPKHMLALYHKYMSGKGKESTVPSTVRNILPMKGKSNIPS